MVHVPGPALDNMHMLPTAHDSSFAELSLHLDGDRAQLVLLTHPEVVIATFKEDDDNPQTAYEIWVAPVPDSVTLCHLHRAPTASRLSCFNDLTGYVYPSKNAATEARTVLTRFGYFVSVPSSTFE